MTKINKITEKTAGYRGRNPSYSIEYRNGNKETVKISSGERNVLILQNDLSKVTGRKCWIKV